MAKIVTTVCDQCGSTRNVRLFEFRTPTEIYKLELCATHAKALVKHVQGIRPDSQPRTASGSKRRKVHKLDENGEPVLG